MKAYLITNRINRKIYIGKTTQTFKKRWNLHLYCALVENRGNYFCNAIRKYGSDVFEMEELLSFHSKEELNNFEKLKIKEFKSTDPKIGYNVL